MTFVIAQITDDNGEISLLADTKVTVTHDVTATRQIYTRPCQKVVILDDDVVAGFAGDTPATALRQLVQLRGRSAEEIVHSLAEYTAGTSTLRGVSKSFVIAKRAPNPRLWTVSNGNVEDRTQIGTAWVGDPDAHREYTGYLHSMPTEWDKKLRLVFAARAVIEFGDIPTVGGYMVRATGSASSAFRFMGDPGSTGPWFTEATITTHYDETASIQFIVPLGADPTELTRIPIPGEGDTFSALAHYVPECSAAWLHVHEDPSADPILLRVRSIYELLDVASSQYRQQLTMPIYDSTRALLGLQPLK